MKFIDIINQLCTGANLAVLGAGLATLVAGFGSARGVNMVARATAGLISEEPDKYGKSMLLQALPMTQGIYGLVAGFMILVSSGLLGGDFAALTNPASDSYITLARGAYYLFAALPVAFGGYYSAIKQGEVATSGISVLAKRPEAVGKAVISASFVELYAILALLISLMLILMA